jgi:hypothetical protein
MTTRAKGRTAAQAQKTYVLEGTLLEACSCGSPCPCWVGDDPDGGKCDTMLAYAITKGQIQGIDVSGLKVVYVAQVPGNMAAGNWRLVIYTDDRATPEQQQALLNAFSGKLGGPLADQAALFGDLIAIGPASIDHQVKDNRGTLRISHVLEVEAAPYTDTQGEPTMMEHAIFAALPIPSAYIGKAAYYRVQIPEYGMTWELQGHSANQGRFHLEAEKG